MKDTCVFGAEMISIGPSIEFKSQIFSFIKNHPRERHMWIIPNFSVNAQAGFITKYLNLCAASWYFIYLILIYQNNNIYNLLFYSFCFFFIFLYRKLEFYPNGISEINKELFFKLFLEKAESHIYIEVILSIIDQINGQDKTSSCKYSFFFLVVILAYYIFIHVLLLL